MDDRYVKFIVKLAKLESIQQGVVLEAITGSGSIDNGRISRDFVNAELGSDTRIPITATMDALILEAREIYSIAPVVRRNDEIEDRPEYLPPRHLMH